MISFTQCNPVSASVLRYPYENRPRGRGSASPPRYVEPLEKTRRRANLVPLAGANRGAGTVGPVKMAATPTPSGYTAKVTLRCFKGAPGGLRRESNDARGAT
ncbi:uncharacterized protein CIMG_12837 [Coccidioides immitis RS]|uniref:Uncharacterized protein n=4 Tax=Coccidioides immitis TaxID=5501 RepID=A0A0D8JVG3_COCIM|nr:uncharacterized protein CIMG_12837 [Coccidioides immitis RS]KJF60268.1 hypothetical protein CIMG_12837 [Coccidioides immitis RS]